MAELIGAPREFGARSDGGRYVVRVWGEPGVDGLWHGWLEFEDAAGARVRTELETAQRDPAALADWAAGLETTYLDGALERARRLRVASPLQR